MRRLFKTGLVPPGPTLPCSPPPHSSCVLTHTPSRLISLAFRPTRPPARIGGDGAELTQSFSELLGHLASQASVGPKSRLKLRRASALDPLPLKLSESQQFLTSACSYYYYPRRHHPRADSRPDTPRQSLVSLQQAGRGPTDDPELIKALFTMAQRYLLFCPLAFFATAPNPASPGAVVDSLSMLMDVATACVGCVMDREALR